ncbi:MAG: ACP S-malonyltransferase [Chitinophagales bacterium]|nr:ACP S-malonyltransferase [Chitinophagales bacterium]
MKAYVFPGQGSQFPGMGKDLYDESSNAKAMFDKADAILGFKLSDVMFNGSEEDLKQTEVTQPAVFVHSVITASVMDDFVPDMVAGHSLGEFSALVANKCLSFDDGLKLVQLRANAMQEACEMNPSTMAAVLGLDENAIEQVLSTIDDEVVVAANYNSPGQLVVSGSVKGIQKGERLLKEAGAKRVIILNVGGAFHSPLMKSAEVKLAEAIGSVEFNQPICPIYQNYNARAVQDPDAIKENLIKQLTNPVRWTHSVQSMIADGATSFTEVGPGKVLQGLIKKIDRSAEVEHA